MFEVEQKFILSKKDIERLTKDADFLSEKTFTDVYYDTAEYALTKNDMWLRKRGEEFELKIPMREVKDSLTQQYQEIEGEEKIREVFAIAVKSDFESDIRAFSYAPFCSFTTTRRKFKKREFIIDLDIVEYDDFKYQIGEIELMVNEKKEIPEAIEKIKMFAQKNKVKIVPVRGKVIEYLKRKRPNHYQALVDAGVVREEK